MRVPAWGSDIKRGKGDIRDLLLGRPVPVRPRDKLFALPEYHLYAAKEKGAGIRVADGENASHQECRYVIPHPDGFEGSLCLLWRNAFGGGTPPHLRDRPLLQPEEHHQNDRSDRLRHAFPITWAKRCNPLIVWASAAHPAIARRY